jgi:hypothetical protein
MSVAFGAHTEDTTFEEEKLSEDADAEEDVDDHTCTACGEDYVSVALGRGWAAFLLCSLRPCEELDRDDPCGDGCSQEDEVYCKQEESGEADAEEV